MRNMMNQNMLRQAQQLQAKMAKVQEELKTLTVEGTSGGGVVKVTANGHQEVISITIDKEVVKPEDAEMLQDLVLAAVKDAIEKSKVLASSKLAVLTGGMKIPGM
ncbi:MAG: YbaB/EbfC family nucleoid-associated protein [Dehalococcoidia bacterium]|nr:YbaB/EbfC family nucleoid-associated protein [Dehalococcoidia bacterium]